MFMLVRYECPEWSRQSTIHAKGGCLLVSTEEITGRESYTALGKSFLWGQMCNKRGMKCFWGRYVKTVLGKFVGDFSASIHNWPENPP